MRQSEYAAVEHECSLAEKLCYPAIGLSRHRIPTDGAGVTTLVASYGCTLRCKYCLNPHCFAPDTKQKHFSVEELIRTVAVDDLYFQATGGGVTFGGGEPLLQSAFICEFGQKCPSEWKINLETALNVPWESLERLIPRIHTYIIDVKDVNDRIYQSYTGRSNEQVLENLKRLCDCVDVSQVRIRLPLIPDYNTVEDVEKSEKFFREMGFSWFDRFPYRVR